MRKTTLFLAALAVGLGGCGGGGGGSSSDDRSARNLTHCERVAQPEFKAEGNAKPPGDKLDPKKRYDAYVETSCGEFTITLDPRSAPNASASFFALAKDGFYDGLTFNRVVPGFVVQAGDPTGTGAGGPGYLTNDVLPGSLSYTRGVVAMWRGAGQAPGTAGSQFFVVTAGDAGLPPAYPVIGRVTNGLDTVRRIGRLGDPSTQQPRRPVVIRGIVVRETKQS